MTSLLVFMHLLLWQNLPLGGIPIGAGGGPIAYVSSVCTGAATPSSVTSTAINATGANRIIISVAHSDTTTVATVSDQATGCASPCNTLTSLTQHGLSGAASSMYYVLNPTVGTNYQVTATSTFGYPSICVIAFSGGGTPAYDSSLGSSSGGGTLQPGSLTPANNNEVLVIDAANNASGAVSIDSSFVLPAGSAGSTAYSAGVWGNSIAYLIQTTATVENPTWTLTGSTNAGTTMAEFR